MIDFKGSQFEREIILWGVRWYVAVAPELPAWDKAGDQATYHAGSVYLYDARGEETMPLPGRRP